MSLLIISEFRFLSEIFDRGSNCPNKFWLAFSIQKKIINESVLWISFCCSAQAWFNSCLQIQKKVYYSLEFFIHLNLTRYGWICFTEVLSVFFFMKQETMCLSDFAFLEKHELHNGWTLGIFEMSQVYFELWQPRNLFHSWALETCFFMSYLFENRDSHFEHL